MNPALAAIRPVHGVNHATRGPDTGAEVAAPGFDVALERLLEKAPENPEEVVPDDTFEEASVGKLRFSRHAAGRMQSRDMQIPDEELARLEGAVDQLAERGGKESLVLLGERAYIVGVPKRTVITMMPRDEALGMVFTHIDSTYVA